MKCQHCGVNFDDGDRECPICGARAGSRGRMSVPRYTDGQHKVHNAESCTHQTFTRDVTFTGRSRKRTGYTAEGEQRRKKNRGRLIILAVVIGILLELLPLAAEVIEDIARGIRYSDYGFAEAMPEPDAPAPEPAAPYSDVGAADILGTHSMAVLPDGSMLILETEQGGPFSAYQMTIAGDGTEYTETGEIWCSYNDPDEGFYYHEDYGPEQYDSYALCLTADSIQTGGETSAELEARAEYGDLWLIAYVDLDTGEVTLEDWDGVGLFGTPLLQLGAVQTG